MNISYNYEVFPNSVQSFWMFQEPFKVIWINLSTNQRTYYVSTKTFLRCFSINRELVYRVVIAFKMTSSAGLFSLHCIISKLQINSPTHCYSDISQAKIVERNAMPDPGRDYGSKRTQPSSWFIFEKEICPTFAKIMELTNLGNVPMGFYLAVNKLMIDKTQNIFLFELNILAS